VRYAGREVELPNLDGGAGRGLACRWAMNLMLINVSTRKLRRAVRLPEGDLPAVVGDSTSKSAASRRFVALSADRLAEWMASDLSKLDLLVIQIDGLHIGNDLVLVAALGIDGDGRKHPLALVEGATDNAAVVRALIDRFFFSAKSSDAKLSCTSILSPPNQGHSVPCSTPLFRGSLAHLGS
jgi:putative transposase